MDDSIEKTILTHLGIIALVFVLFCLIALIFTNKPILCETYKAGDIVYFQNQLPKLTVYKSQYSEQHNQCASYFTYYNKSGEMKDNFMPDKLLSKELK